MSNENKKSEGKCCFSVVLVLGCLLSAGLGVWIADAGGKIRRVDFREQPV